MIIMMLLIVLSTGLLTASASIITGSTLEKDFEQIALDEHNKLRRMHQISEPMTLGMNMDAQKCSEHYASIGTIDHSCKFSKGFGENLFAMSGGTGADIVKEAIKIWYAENKHYNYNKPGFSPSTGHFTQLIWKGSKKLRFGIAKNANTGTYFVTALYYPPGNFENQYTANVLRPVKT